MDNTSLFSKLKIKPIPKTKDESSISLKLKPEIVKEFDPVKLKTSIIDKREELTVNRDEILKKIKNVFEADTKKIDVPESIVSTKEESSELLDIGDEEDVIKIKKIKPKQRKIKLVISSEKDDELPKITIKKEKTLKTKPDDIISGPTSLLQYEEIKERLPKEEEKIIIKAPSYYLDNRQIFINFINSLFLPYKEELSKMLESYSCDSSDKDFSLLVHQKLVRDYLNLFTPYRGLLLYHGLGSGKTCSSIAIAEGFKSDKQIYIMTPKSLRRNYIEELKKCGDLLFRKKQFWEFISVINADEINNDLVVALSHALNLSTTFIKKNKGAWLVNIKIKESNYDKLSSKDQDNLDKQLDEMIGMKYKFINYNGINNRFVNNLTLNNTVNPFTDSVVIIDEAHNFVSRIVNKIEREKKIDEPLYNPVNVSLKLYKLLLDSENSRVVLLSGTPIINYPNEIAIAMNILRGRINKFNFDLKIQTGKSLKKEDLINILSKNTDLYNTIDYIEFFSKTNNLQIVKNPYGFSNILDSKSNYTGVKKSEIKFDNNEFSKLVIDELTKNKIKVVSNKVDIFNCLPHTLDSFAEKFMDRDDKRSKYGKIKNMNLFKKRILGLTSYFPDIEVLLPKYQEEKDFHVVKIQMSDHQFAIYEESRIQERKLELKNSQKKKLAQSAGIHSDTTSTYRIFSRAFCNFVFPKEIKRPMPRDVFEMSNLVDETLDTELKKDLSKDLPEEVEKGDEDIDDMIELASVFSDDDEIKKSGKTYQDRIELALESLKDKEENYLSEDSLLNLSPKFLKILQSLNNGDNLGLHMLYSQFRSMEGISILSLVLNANGYTQFKIKKNSGKWSIDIPLSEVGKKMYALYTGTEDDDEKEIIRNIFNSDWGLIPPELKIQLEKISGNNHFGEIIKLIMITASGAEGISLKNVRYVHITEPYWHPVRMHQVIGRARRICSHKDLKPKDLQTVNVFLYLMTFSEEQLTSDKSIELRLKDTSKIDNKTPLTSDEALFEISNIKNSLNSEILKNLKESAIDCNINNGISSKDNLTCYSFGTVDTNKYSYLPEMKDYDDNFNPVNQTVKSLRIKKVKIPELPNVDTVIDIDTFAVYTLESYKKNNLLHIGNLKTYKNEKTGKEEYKYEKL